MTAQYRKTLPRVRWQISAAGRPRRISLLRRDRAAAAESAAEHIAAAHGRRRAKKAAKAEADTIREGSAAGQRPSSRLQFTEEELADPELQKYIRRSNRAADRLDAAKEAVPKKKVLKTGRVFDETAGRGKTRLRFEEVEKRPNGHLRHNPLSRPAQEVLLAAHSEVHKVEQENVGVEAGHKGEELAERGLSYGKSKVQAGYPAAPDEALAGRGEGRTGFCQGKCRFSLPKGAP